MGILSATRRIPLYLFDQLSNKSIEVPDPIATSYFVSDLQPELRKEIEVYKPHSLVHAMSLARLSDEKNRDHNFSELEDPYSGEKPTAYSRSTNLQPLLPHPSSDDLPKPVKTQLLVTIKKLYVYAVHNQILKKAWEQIESLCRRKTLPDFEQKCRKTS